MLCFAFMNDGSLCSSCYVFTKPLHNIFHMTLINFPFKLTQLCLSYSYPICLHLTCCKVYVAVCVYLHMLFDHKWHDLCYPSLPLM